MLIKPCKMSASCMQHGQIYGEQTVTVAWVKGQLMQEHRIHCTTEVLLKRVRKSNLVTRGSQLGAQRYFIIGYCYQRGKVGVKECDVAY